MKSTVRSSTNSSSINALGADKIPPAETSSPATVPTPMETNPLPKEDRPTKEDTPVTSRFLVIISRRFGCLLQYY